MGGLEVGHECVGLSEVGLVVGIGNHWGVEEEVFSGISEVGVLIEDNVSEHHSDVIQVQGLNLLHDVVGLISPNSVIRDDLRVDQLEDELPLSGNSSASGDVNQPELRARLGNSLPEVKPGDGDQVSWFALELELIEDCCSLRSGKLGLEVLRIGLVVEGELLVIEGQVVLVDTHGKGSSQNEH